MVLTDTFQLAEGASALEGLEVLEDNSERARRQRAQKITVVMANPPNSVGQESVNDNNQNLKYDALDHRIAETYIARSNVGNKTKIYNSYIRAIRWASDRLNDEGVVALVSNGGYIDDNSADGLRKSLVDEFDAIYCYNLRGNARTAGDLRRREAGNVFESGSRNTVAILILVKGAKDAAAGTPCRLFYRDIGDYLSREDKLRLLASQDLESVQWQPITPNADGDWINQRDQRYRTFRAIGDKDRTARTNAVFAIYSNGLNSARDAWVYNFAEQRVWVNMKRMIKFYNNQVDGFRRYCAANGASPTVNVAEQWIDTDHTKISWNRADKTRLATTQKLYLDSRLNDMTYQMPRVFPSMAHENFGFYMTGPGGGKPFSVLAVNAIPDLAFWGSGTGQFYPRYRYQKLDEGDGLFASAGDAGYERVDNITDAALADYCRTYGDATITKDDVFYYVYGLLHSTEYRERYAADLKKSLPRIPKVRDFRGYADAGRRLAELHIGYEEVEPHPGIVETVAGDASATPLGELFRSRK
jgi:predicted helicase